MEIMELPASVRFGYRVYACLRTHDAESLLLEEGPALEFLKSMESHRLTGSSAASTYLSRNLLVRKSANRVDASWKRLANVVKLDKDEASVMTLVTLGLFGMALKAVPASTQVRVTFGSELSECLRLLPAASPELATMLRSVLGLADGPQPRQALASTRLRQLDGIEDFDSGMGRLRYAWACSQRGGRRGTA